MCINKYLRVSTDIQKLKCIVLIPGLARRVDLGLELSRVEEKIKEGKTWCDLAS